MWPPNAAPADSLGNPKGSGGTGVMRKRDQYDSVPGASVEEIELVESGGGGGGGGFGRV